MKLVAQAVALLSIALTIAMTPAQASNLPTNPSGSPTVLCDQSDLVIGTQASEATLNLPTAGELFLTVTDEQFTNPFASLLVAVTNATGTVVGLTNSSTVSLNVSGPTTLYADVFATAQPGGADAGLYNITATFVPQVVPLPPSWALIATGTGLLLGLTIRRRERATVIKGMA